MIDLEPAALRLSTLLAVISDDDLARPTPCPDATVGDLVDHVSMFAVSFLASARKETEGRDGPAPTPSAANLGPDWRDRVSRELLVLAGAWREPAAWEGVTFAGGIEMPAAMVGLVTIDELVVHGWDIVVATGRPFVPSAEEVEAATAFVGAFDVPRDGTLFGPEVPVVDGSTPFERLLGLAGRDPHWRPLN